MNLKLLKKFHNLNLCLDLEGGKFFFNTVREGDSVLFATEDEGDANNWVRSVPENLGSVHTEKKILVLFLNKSCEINIFSGDGFL